MTCHSLIHLITFSVLNLREERSIGTQCLSRAAAFSGAFIKSSADAGDEGWGA